MTTQRTHEVDVIRLVALLGICIANIPTMGVSDGLGNTATFGLDDEALLGLEESVLYGQVTAQIDQYAKFFKGLFVDGKFILLFSFIFGWGISMQEKRITSSGGEYKRYYFRRSFGLILLGVIHMAFIFGGDVLLMYGATALIFWYMRDYVLRTPVKPFLWQMIRYQYMTLILCSFVLLSSVFIEMDDLTFFSASNDALGGTFSEATRYRLVDGGSYQILALLMFTFETLAAFGLGYRAEHAGFFREGSESFHRLRELLPKLFIFGVICNVIYALGISEMGGDLTMVTGMLLWLVGAPAMAAVYLYGLIIIARRIQLPEIFVLAGQNSLSVYVLQGLIASLMFGGYGLGWFGEFGELALIPISVGIYFVTVIVVGLYAQRYGRGFLEPVLRGISSS